MVFSHGVAPCSSALLSVLLLVLIVTMTTGQQDYSMTEEIQNNNFILKNEEPCLTEGGICVVRGFCPKENLLNKTGLCPEQEKEGAVCCNGIPKNASCDFQGGRCGQEEECQNVENFGQLDCKDGKQCCLLIF